ncbi:hypothetical protein BD626DRAFT_475140 [Schizophyllum amplum]|uniref:Secreted protein n=1 Tax=Schizophyllum amplum TaxID=97359 RepID=A0A550CY65_9AGAR|nr:hypothetical protein BD626DRAFT_475140 [Auriculariopsis ampla]
MLATPLKPCVLFVLFQVYQTAQSTSRAQKEEQMVRSPHEFVIFGCLRRKCTHPLSGFPAGASVPDASIQGLWS